MKHRYYSSVKFDLIIHGSGGRIQLLLLLLLLLLLFKALQDDEEMYEVLAG